MTDGRMIWRLRRMNPSDDEILEPITYVTNRGTPSAKKCRMSLEGNHVRLSVAAYNAMDIGSFNCIDIFKKPGTRILVLKGSKESTPFKITTNNHGSWRINGYGLITYMRSLMNLPKGSSGYVDGHAKDSKVYFDLDKFLIKTYRDR